MKTQYYKCKLISDIVVNASLATEGNMTTLDYIPGSNFLGIVAGELYKDNNSIASDELFDIFHSGKVSFGDALLSVNDSVSCTVPFSLFQDKLNKGLGKEDKKTWVHHSLNGKRPENGDGFIQLKQHRGGFLNSKNDFIKKVEKQFSLKSAHNREERRSAEGKMFGFESIKKGQEFVFSVIFEDDKYVDIVSKTLEGRKRIGKSKTAQFGQVEIEKIETKSYFESKQSVEKQLLIYAESNLCFLNNYGQSTFQPKPSDFGIQGLDDISLRKEGYGIDWNDSQIRTYSYSPWNTHRNTTNSQRDTIAKGSVIVINLKDDIDVLSLKTQVGEYTAEGLGRVIYNPEFLKADNEGKWLFIVKEIEKKIKVLKKPNKIETSTKLGGFLHNKLKDENIELKIGKAVIDVIDNKTLTHKDITKSQWGAIRTKATNAKDIESLMKELFVGSDAFLNHGVSAERIWDKNRGDRRIALEKVIKDNKELGTKFVARLASDIAKLN